MSCNSIPSDRRSASNHRPEVNGVKSLGDRRRVLLAFVVFALAAAGCVGGDVKRAGDGGAGTIQATTTAAVGNEVEMRLIAYRPEVLILPVGSMVTWTQKDAGLHTVTSGTVTQGAADVITVPDGRFDSGNLAPGQAFRHTFQEAGAFPYFCALHPATMRGEIRVT